MLIRSKPRLIAAALAGALSLPPTPLAPAFAQNMNPPQTTAEGPATAEADTGDVQPKFIWGILIKFLAGEVFSAFSQWTAGKVMGQVSAAPISGSGVLGGAIGLTKAAIDVLRNKKDTKGGAYIARNADAALSTRDAPEITDKRPETPIQLKGGSPNYQGVHIAMVGIDRNGMITELRSVSEGFRTGERFKLRVISTFNGLLVVENINPKGERRQIYPSERNAVVVVQAGADTLLPLEPNESFEFARTAGEEQLVIYLRDPRAVGNAASREKVHRKDETYGSNFVQEVADSTYPVIAQAISLQHR